MNTPAQFVNGATPGEAFSVAQDAARHLYGHNGNTGTIAEAPDYEVLEVPPLLDWSALHAARTLLERAPDVDAVFVASDLMAQGVLDALARAGKRVPEDIAVGGFDDSPAALSSQPPLTTIRQPWDRISAEMVRTLLARIAGEDPATVILPTELVIRESA